MNNYANLLSSNNLGFTAIFFCLLVGFLFLRRVDEEESCISIWAFGFGFNGLGFLLWSGFVPMDYRLALLAGDLLHLIGFMMLVFGILVYLGRPLGRRVALGAVAVVAFWAVGVVLAFKHPFASLFFLRSVRVIIFMGAGALLIFQKFEPSLPSHRLAGRSLLVWGLYLALSGFLPFGNFSALKNGLLTGFHVLAALGMVAMIMDRIRLRAERSEKAVRQLESLLPICGFCKKIRDGKDDWRPVDEYISAHTETEFSHGVCPECAQKHYGEYLKKD